MTGTYSHYAREYCQGAYCYHPKASPFRHFAEWPAKGYRAVDFPKTELLVDRVVSIPLGTLYRTEDADVIAEAIQEVHGELMG